MRRQKDNKRRNQNQDNFLKPKRACQFTAAGVDEIDYKDVELLKKIHNRNRKDYSSTYDRYQCKVSASAY